MKIKQEKLRKLFLLLIGCFILTNLAAQTENVTVKGIVTDQQGQGIIGVSVVEKGTINGAQTDLDGDYEINVPANATLEFSFIGFSKQEVQVNGRTSISLTMNENAEQLDEVIIIGYGAVKKSDLTGSITAIGEKDFQKGIVTSPTELISGKVAGVQITSNGGRAGSGSRIRIRGGASLNASNDPLIVIDGVPLDAGGMSGSSDPLSTINPSDIESMNILKDASATAIYGSRASNGVVLITTKKGKAGQKLNINLSTQNSLSYNSKKVDLMSANQFRNTVTNNPLVKQRYIDMLGTANTDWQDEIYRTAFTTDNNLSISGSVKNMPYRVSVSYLNQDGILDTDNMQRTTGSINISPKFLQDHLSVNLNLKGTYSNQRFGNGDAIGAALRMDPTQPIKADGFDEFNGYWTWVAGGKIQDKATKNPIALLKSKNDKSDVYRSIGNAQVDYKMHFLPELRANMNLGYDISQGKGDVVIQRWGPQAFTNTGDSGDIGGERSKYKQNKRNLLMEFYLNYVKELKEIDSRIDVMGGYTYQDWEKKDYNYIKTTYNGDPSGKAPAFPSATYQNTLISYFGRLNYTFKERYLLTATVRRDGSSRFGTDNRWGTFPSVALAWRISEEDFMRGFDKLSNLKLRLGYGVTGQQEIGDYEYIPTYSYSESSASVQFGDQFHQMWRPNGYDKDRKWEQTQTYNIGLDYGFFDGRVNGGIDYYYKKTKDLLATIPLPIGSNFTNMMVKNIGKLDNQGVEFNVNVIAIQTNDIQWDLGLNATYNNTKLTQLSANDKNNIGVTTGGISGGTGSTVQIHSIGYAPSTFYLYKQLYDSNGKPIEGAYADLNGDGKINDDDRYHYKKPEADWFFGFNTNLTYQKWSLGTSLRASVGNYVYNNIYSDAGNFSQVLNPLDFLANAPKDLLKTEFYNRSLFSDYYVQNASFLKMDYLTLGYDFGSISKKHNINLKANFTVQNVFTLTKYDGVDPEIAGGIDNNFYPNPRTFVVGLNLNF